MPTEQKRYYWLKLSDDFFKQKEIKKLRSIAGGDTFTIIYLKMLLRSMQDGGKLYYEGIEDNFVSELALDIDEDEDNVAVTVQFLIAKGILHQNTVSEYEVITAAEMTGSECESARRVRKMRATKRLELPANEGVKALQCNGDVTTCNTEKDIEKEIDINIPKAPKGRVTDSPDFDRFWRAYPNKKVKTTALKAWKKLKPDDTLVQAIMKDVERRLNGEWKRIDKQYIPHPTTYLNQRRWEDEDYSGEQRFTVNQNSTTIPVSAKAAEDMTQEELDYALKHGPYGKFY